jgi:hypothetical protein
MRLLSGLPTKLFKIGVFLLSCLLATGLSADFLPSENPFQFPTKLLAKSAAAECCEQASSSS